MAQKNEYGDGEVQKMMEATAERIRVRLRTLVSYRLTLREVYRFNFWRCRSEICGYEICCEETIPFFFLFGRYRFLIEQYVALFCISHAGGGQITIDSLDPAFDQVAIEETEKLIQTTECELSIS